MKPFNLEEAKAGKPVCTRDGKFARIICFDVKTITDKYPILVLISVNGDESCFSYTKDGKYASNDHETNYDLMMASEKHEGWVNIYKHGNTRDVGALYDTLEKAKESKDKANYITTIKIEWEE